MEAQRLWINQKFDEIDAANKVNKKDLKFLTPAQLKNQNLNRAKFTANLMHTWADLISWLNITDQDIHEILLKGDQDDKSYADHSKSSDAARRAILKLYSYESPLYKATNLANQTRD